MFGLFILLPVHVLSGFFIVTDLHYDIAYKSNYNSTFFCHSQKLQGYPETPVPTTDIQEVARPLCDSSFTLLNITFNTMKSINAFPDFILLTGDSIGHFTSSLLQPNGDYNPQINLQLLKQTYIDIADLITKTFPDTQVIPMIGNDDAYNDYEMPEGWDKMQYLDFLYTLWTPITKSISSTFLKDGYYSTVTGSGYNVLVLNTLFFSKYYNVNAEGEVEMLWLKQQLSLKSKVLIAMHIPPGVNLYNGGDASWNDYFTQIFIDLVSMYQKNIAGIFSGHYHNGFFQFVGEIPIIINPSISPLFGNNPGFRFYSDENFNYTEYTYNEINDWIPSTFEGVYGYPTNFTRLYDEIESGAVPIEVFMERMTGWWVMSDYNQTELCEMIYGFGPCSKSQNVVKQITLCSIKYLLYSEFEKCVSQLEILIS